MINELLHKYANQKAKNFGENHREKCYPVSAVIAMLEEQKQALILPVVVKSVKGKQTPTFEEFAARNGYKQISNSFVYKSGKGYANKEWLSKMYRDEYPL